MKIDAFMLKQPLFNLCRNLKAVDAVLTNGWMKLFRKDYVKGEESPFLEGEGLICFVVLTDE